MSQTKDPPRLLDPASDTTPGVRDVLRAAQRELPSADALARLAARLPVLPPGGGSPPPPPAPPAPPASPLGPFAALMARPEVSGAILGALLAGGAVVGASWVAPAPRAAPAVAAARAEPAPRPEASAPAPAVAAPPAATMSAAPARPAPPAIPGTGAPPPDGPSVAASEPAPAAEEETEVRLLQRARAGVAADPARALALTGEHARRFPGGAFAQEREFIAISALVALGRADEARERAARMLERFPASAYRDRLEAIVPPTSVQKERPVSPPTR
jgi:hypothetical protein